MLLVKKMLCEKNNKWSDKSLMWQNTIVIVFFLLYFDLFLKNMDLCKDCQHAIKEMLTTLSLFMLNTSVLKNSISEEAIQHEWPKQKFLKP